MDKPKNVTLAVNLMWLSIALGIIRGFLIGFNASSTQVSPIFIALVVIGTIAILGFLFFKISAGRNWARITYAILFLLGIPGSIALIFSGQLFQSPIAGLFMLIQTGLQAYALVLIFTNPGKTWFQKTSNTPLP